MHPEISVVIPTKDRMTLLVATLRRLFRVCQDLAGAIEVVVVDDGASGLPGLLTSFHGEPLRIVANEGSGAASARNTGVAQSRYALLLFLDDDILVGKRNLMDHFDTHGRFPGSVVSGVARLEAEFVHKAKQTAFGRYKLKYDYALNAVQRLAPLSEGCYRVASVASFNLSLWRDDFNRIGGFNARMPYAGCEDQELSVRARAKGLELILDERVECYHNELDRLEAERWFLRQFTGIQGTVILAHTYPERKSQSVYRALSPASFRDPPGILFRKIIAAALAFGPTPRLLLGLLRALERVGLPDVALFQGYRALWVVHAHLGFREGLRRLSAAPYSAASNHSGGSGVW